MVTTDITIQAATESDRFQLIDLLKQSKLPTDDLPSQLDNFLIAREGQQVIGCVGLQTWDSYALLRSLAVHPALQSKGLGTQLYHAIIKMAAHNSVKEVYLITTTAERFFDRQGFQRIERSEAPDVISQTEQFSSLCPSSAVVMMKSLNNQ